MTPQEAIKARKSLRKQIRRANNLALRCSEQAADPSLTQVDRESMAHRAKLAGKLGASTRR